MSENKMGVMPVPKLIVTMALPAIISMIVGAMYNVVESIFVARIGASSLTAMTYVLPVQMFMISVGIGSGVGLNSLISRRLGQKRQDEANLAASHGFFIALFNWAIFALFGIFFAEKFLALYSSDPYILSSAVLYCRIVTICSLFSFITVATERILQSTGNMIYPMIFNLVGAGLNIILSPILILGLLGVPRLGIIGAGIAAIICQFTSMIIALTLLFKGKLLIKIQLRGFRLNGRILKDVYKVGLPSIIMMSIGSVMTIGVNAILRFNPVAVAVFGIYFRINSFVFMPIFGLNQGALPVMGYNYGARNRKRLMTAWKTTSAIAITLMGVGTLAFWVFTRPILHLFSADAEMMEIGVPALRYVSLGFVFAAYAIETSTVFQALAHGLLSMFVSILRQIVLCLPMTWILLTHFGLNAAWFSFSIGEVGAAILTTFFFIRIYKKEIKTL
jgi:putative MATE family efflux protein